MTSRTSAVLISLACFAGCDAGDAAGADSAPSNPRFAPGLDAAADASAVSGLPSPGDTDASAPLAPVADGSAGPPATAQPDAASSSSSRDDIPPATGPDTLDASVNGSGEESSAELDADTRDPRFAVEGSLDLEPELVLPLPLGGGQVHNLQVTEDWLYFSGRISTGQFPEANAVDGMGVFRMRKEPAARPEPLFAAPASTFFYRYHWDGESMHYLDWERVLIWRETAEGTLPEFTEVALDARYDFIGGDQTTVFAYTNNCVRITLIDKASLETSVWEPPNAWAAGGVWGMASDEAKLYCTGVQEDGRAVLYTLDKASGEITDTTITHAGNANLLQLAPGFIDGGYLYQIMTPYHFGKLDLSSGVFTTLMDNPVAWTTIPIHRDGDSSLVYWVGTENVWRYDLNDDSYVPFMNHNMLIKGRSSLDRDYVYFVTGYDGNKRPDDIVGIVRIAKPSADL